MQLRNLIMLGTGFLSKVAEMRTSESSLLVRSPQRAQSSQHWGRASRKPDTLDQKPASATWMAVNITVKRKLNLGEVCKNLSARLSLIGSHEPGVSGEGNRGCQSVTNQELTRAPSRGY